MEEHQTSPVRFPLVQRASPDLSALMAVIRRLSVCRSVPEIMETVTPAARRMLAADGVTFVLRDGDRCHYAEEDAISPLWKGKRFPMSACISGWCMIERRTAAIEDIYSDPRIPHDAYRPTFVRSLAMVPVPQDDPVAALGAYWRERRTIRPVELELLQSIANAAGLALANIQLTEEREKAARARLELGHRIRNVLAVVDALARQTLRRAPSLEGFGAAFSGRLRALAHAQNALEAPGAAGSNIRTLVEEQVMLDDIAGRIECRGPDVAVGGDEVLDLALALHELGTNARKHGALSDDSGRVVIDWRIETQGDDPVVRLAWIEQDGPAVSPPGDGGLGSLLLRNAFRRNGGGIEMRFEATGVQCHMRIPLRPNVPEPEPASPADP